MSKNWKIERDPFYNELFSSIGLDGIKEAGFFEDTAIENENISDSVSVLCTPLSFMSNRISAAKNPCILLTTGSFCPLHNGHVQMMELSKKHLENLGYDVVGGFISPGHDEYISAKNKSKAIPIHYRIRTVVDMIKHIDWLSVDPWEGQFCKVAVNFTDVYMRLNEYVKAHIGFEIPIFFVSGGDNARFAMTFMKKGNCIIIDRPPYTERFLKYKEILKECKNIHFVEGGIAISSTEIRKDDFVPEPKKKLIIRVENEEKRRVAFLMDKYFSSVERREVSQQKKYFYKNMPLGTMISLDSLLKSVHGLKISRCYDMFGTIKLGFTNRPGTPTIQEQLSEIDQGEYSLFDDDIHTGSTMRFAKKLIEETGSKVREIISLNISSPENAEILDCRDFFVGGKNNGLVVKMPDGKNVRAPYLYPYVCPFIRASVGDPIGFSIEGWQMNMDVYEKSNHKLADFPFLYDLFKRAGFKMEDSMYQICKWHRDLLVSLNTGRSV